MWGPILDCDTWCSPKAASLGDQKRVMTPKEAIDSGANQIVVGRPITQAIDSFQATKSIFAEINE